MKSKIEAFIKKLNIWIQKVENDSFDMFSFTDDFLASNDVESDAVKPIITSHLTNLMEIFQRYFRPGLDNAKLDWIQNPFIVSNQSMELHPPNSQEEFAEMSSDSKLQREFAKKSLALFG